MDYNYIEKYPTPEEYNYLRKKVGWGIYDIEVINNSIKNSLYCITVYDNNKIIGMGRVIGDNGLCFYIQDIIVIPKYQKQKVGSNIMTKIMNYIKGKASNNSIIGLMSAYNKEKFYEKYGFTIRHNDKLGSGMTLFFKNNIKNKA